VAHDLSVIVALLAGVNPAATTKVEQAQLIDTAPWLRVCAGASRVEPAIHPLPPHFDVFYGACYDGPWLFQVMKESVVKRWTLAGNLQALGGIRLQSDDAMCTRAVSAQCP